jgi:hypothetical protein
MKLLLSNVSARAERERERENEGGRDRGRVHLFGEFVDFALHHHQLLIHDLDENLYP